MKTLHFECFAGISGDMTLGALVDLGVDPGDLRRELGKLGVGGWKLDFAADQRNGIGGTRAVVDLEGTDDHVAHDEDPQYHYRPVYAKNYIHGPGQPHEHSHEHQHEHSHNSWKEIRALIEGSKISGGAKKRALDIFSRIARAEAKVHGLPPEDVAFHEVGALDSIIDIVGTAVCLDILKPERVTCTEIELGGGTVKCAHGILPVPAPATLLLVQGLPVRTGGFNKEMTTPTGAAILAASVDEFITGPVSFRELKTGVGIGTRKMERPNVLRVSWRETPEALPPALSGNSAGKRPWETEALVLLEANIDDMTGEALGFLMERLFEAGALDLSFGSIVMKKSRPGTLVSVLARPAELDTLRECLFRNSTTIGFREIPVNRVSLRRQEETLEGDFGSAGLKTVFLGDEKLRAKVEFEDRARLARERGIALDEAERRILRRFGGEPRELDARGSPLSPE
ncbi:MAG: nickel pincer cofactor biosynthesis protein LarC [Treponema sp.]|nr:nickel pincer cofactor biosynthesis protein LarC [Treponema sp.]